MRKLVYFTTITLDGYFSGPDGELDNFVPAEPEHQYANDLLRDSDALLFGRRMYELMSYWDGVDANDSSLPRVEREFAAIYQDKARIVLSRTLDSVDDKATLISDNVIEEIGRLKQRDGGYLGLGCGPALLSLLLENGLVDEIRLMVLPLLLGQGVRLFEDGRELKSLRLVSSQTFPSGSVLLSYDAG